MKEVPLKMVTYERNKVVAFMKEKGIIMPTDLVKLGYDMRTGGQILGFMQLEGLVEPCGMKEERPAVLYKTDRGDVRKVSGARYQSAFRLTKKGANDDFSQERDVFYLSSIFDYHGE